MAANKYPFFKLTNQIADCESRRLAPRLLSPVLFLLQNGSWECFYGKCSRSLHFQNRSSLCH